MSHAGHGRACFAEMVMNEDGDRNGDRYTIMIRPVTQKPDIFDHEAGDFFPYMLKVVNRLNELTAQNADLLAACQGLLLANDPKSPACGCGEAGPCAWHYAYQMVNRAAADPYGEWYAAAATGETS